jgi:cardiolipin synthase
VEEPNGDEIVGEDRLLTIPNLLSIGRLLCVPLFLYLLFGRHDRAWAAILLAALGATDWVDGYVARHFDQVSTLGKVLDPLADRILLGVAVVALLVDGSVPAWVGVLAIAREVVVGVAAVVLAAMGARRIDVTWVGKAGTFGLMFAFPMFLASHSTLSIHREFGVAAWLCVVPGLGLSYYAALTYVPIARRALEEGRVGSER